MDAVRFIKEAKRMCESYYSCKDCPATGELCYEKFIRIICPEEFDDFVDVVEKWSKENPIVTNRQMMKEVFGIDVLHDMDVQLNEIWLNKEYKKPEERKEG